MSADFADLATEVTRFIRSTGVAGIRMAGTDWGLMTSHERILPFQENGRDPTQVVLDLNSDAWFGAMSQPHSHVALCVLRAVELRFAVVRAPRTGTSALLLPTGEIAPPTVLAGGRTLVGDVPLRWGGAAYSWTDRWSIYGCTLWLLLFWLVEALDRRFRPRS